MLRTSGSLSRMLVAGVVSGALLLSCVAVAGASRSPSTEERDGIYAGLGYTSSADCSSVYVSTIDQSWAYVEQAYIANSACPATPGGKIAWFLQKTNGAWAVTASSSSYSTARLCPVFSSSDAIPPSDVYSDIHHCGSAVAPGATPTPTPPASTPVPTPTKTPLPQLPNSPSVSSGAGSSARSSQNTRILCLQRGSSSRTARRKPITCNTLGPDDSFSGAVNLAKLKWRSWGRSVATATGVDRGFQSPPSKIRVRVTASRPRANDCGGWSYTRLTVRSKYGTIRQSLPAACED